MKTTIELIAAIACVLCCVGDVVAVATGHFAVAACMGIAGIISCVVMNWDEITDKEEAKLLGGYLDK